MWISVLWLVFVPFWLWYSSSTLLASIETTISDVKTQLKPIDGMLNQLKRARNYQNIKNSLAALGDIGVNRGIWLKIFDNINAVYMEAAKKIVVKKSSKIWILDLSSKKMSESIKFSEKQNKVLP